MGSDIEEFAPANLGLDSRRQTGTFGKNERRIDKLSDGLYSTLPSHRSVQPMLGGGQEEVQD